MKKIRTFIFIGVAIFSTISCNKFLDTKSESQRTLDSYYTSYLDCRTATAGLYNVPWYTFASQFYFTAGDGRGNNLFTPYNSAESFGRLTETIETPLLPDAWNSLYNVVTQSDYVVNNIDNALSHGVTQAQVNACRGEARFMRGLAYWYLGSIWGNVPIVEDPVAASKSTLVKPNRFEDILQYSIQDLQYAAKWLPETDVAGRVTKYSALGILSRLYITAACYARGNRFSSRWTLTAENYYDSALNAAQKVCQASNYSLMSDYEQLFRVQNNNNSESLFALQFVPGSSVYGVGNRNQDWLAYSTTLTGGLTAYGGNTFASGELVNLMFTRGETSRQKGTYFYPGATYNYLGTQTTAGSWTVSGANAVRYPNIKKMVVGSKQDAGGLAINGNSGLAAPMLRLAEVYLLYVEAIMGLQTTTSDPVALLYFNKVRNRAGMPSVTSISIADLWDERRVELALEGQFWYDMVRRSYWDQDWVLNYMNNQHRSQYYYYLSGTAPTGFAWRTQTDGQQQNVATASRLLLPYPATELVLNPSLDSTAVPFHF